MATNTAPAPARSKAKSSDVMAFSFSDTIAGYVGRYDRNADSFTLETSDGLLDHHVVRSIATTARSTISARSGNASSHRTR